jgi:RND family efflux transporter MFP subunit
MLGGSAAILAKGVLSAMSMTYWWKVASLLLVAGATVSTGGIIRGKGTMAVAARPQDSGKGLSVGQAINVPVIEVKAGKFEVDLRERGSLEVIQSEDLRNHVEGSTTIISILPEGTRVKKGDLVCELDSAVLRDTLTNQEIAIQGAEAAYQNAKLTRETAEIAVKEYEEGIYLQDRATVQGEIKLAESALQKAKDRLDRTGRAQRKLAETLSRNRAALSSSDIIAELDLDDRHDASELAVLRETVSLEKAQNRLALLENFTKGKTLKDLKSDVEKTLSSELAEKQRWQLEKNKETKLEKQIVACRIIAPIDGVVTLANNPNRLGGSPFIGEGATVRERQVLVHVIDFGSPLQVNAKIPEQQINRVRTGQKAQVTVDAFPGEVYTGVVSEVSPLPDPGSARSSVKVFTTRIKLDKISKSLRPGMTADIVVPIVERDDALIVLAQSVLHADGKDRVAVKQPDGGFEWREIVLGDRDGQRVEVKQGLKPGDLVALEFSVLVRDGMNRGKNVAPAKQ